MGTRTTTERARPVGDWAAVAAARASGRLAVVCAECGQEFTATRSDAAFCSRACAARARRQSVRRCASCRRSLPRDARSTIRYCTTACRKRAYRRRQAAAKREAGGGAS